MKFPDWIRKHNCIWCNGKTEPIKIKETKYDGKKVVQVSYKCKNKNCLYKKRYGRFYITLINYCGTFVCLYKDWKQNKIDKKHNDLKSDLYDLETIK